MDVTKHTLEPLISMMSAHPRNILMDHNLAERRNRCPFISSGSTAIAWDGSLSPCLPLMHQHTNYLLDLQHIEHRHVIGNVSEQGLVALWESPDYENFRKRVDDFDFSICTVCASCEMTESNQEDCFGNTFPTCGGCLWAQGFIRCP
jgi:MoaA/NifB/PqqE/SkfB family radical SAM enzyme